MKDRSEKMCERLNLRMQYDDEKERELRRKLNKADRKPCPLYL